MVEDSVDLMRSFVLSERENIYSANVLGSMVMTGWDCIITSRTLYEKETFPSAILRQSYVPPTHACPTKILS